MPVKITNITRYIISDSHLRSQVQKNLAMCKEVATKQHFSVSYHVKGYSTAVHQDWVLKFPLGRPVLVQYHSNDLSLLALSNQLFSALNFSAVTLPVWATIEKVKPKNRIIHEYLPL